MKKLVAISLFVFLYLSSTAQFSVSAKYSLNSFPEWEEIIDGSTIPNTGFIGDGAEYGFSYWFRLKNYRVEFLPEISFQSLKSENEAFQTHGFEKTSYYLNLTTQIYTLDIEGDCNCPTWGKDGNFIQKGFFVGINPSIGYHKLDIVDNEIAAGSQSSNKINLRLGVSTGLDIGIAKWITLTPFAALNYTPGLGWDNLENIASGGAIPQAEDKSKIWAVQPGIRLMFRPDYLKEQRGMFR